MGKLRRAVEEEGSGQRVAAPFSRGGARGARRTANHRAAPRAAAPVLRGMLPRLPVCHFRAVLGGWCAHHDNHGERPPREEGACRSWDRAQSRGGWGRGIRSEIRALGGGGGERRGAVTWGKGGVRTPLTPSPLPQTTKVPEVRDVTRIERIGESWWGGSSQTISMETVAWQRA